jgi:DNA-binding NtrC family response regulator
MASVSGSLFDSEFFGHTKGAFTGATGDRMGYLEYTNRGILFLDEVGDLSIEFQGKLLRVLQDGEFIKLGRNVPQKADIRFIAATNKNLEQMVSRGSFRKDLYYRLKGAWLNLPPLRERMEDLPLLVSHFMEEFCGSAENPGVEEETMALLMGYDFPGNIRELRSLIQSALNLAQGRRISPAFLPTYLRNRKLISERVFLKKEVMLVLPLKDLEKNHILKVYEMTGKNKVNAAKILKIGINTLRRKLEFYGVE